MKHTVGEYELTGGAKGLLVDVPGASVYNLVIRFNSGFQFADSRVYELPHVMEHLISCGSQAYPEPNQFKIEVQKNGAYRNAFTNSEANGYVMECAAFELDRMLDLFEEYLTRPLFPEEAVATELSNVREELNRLVTDHEAVCANALAVRAFPRRSMGYEQRIKQLPRITRQQIVEHYQATHTQGNMRFYMAGDLAGRQAELLDRLDRLVRALPAGKRQRPEAGPGEHLAEPVVTERAIGPIYYRLASYYGELTRPERQALVVARDILFGGYQGRIFGEARRRGLAYHVGGNVNAGRGQSMMGVAGFVTPDHSRELFELIAREYQQLRQTAPLAEEVAASQNRLIGSLVRSYQTAGDILGWYVGPYDDEELVLSFEEYIDELRQIEPAVVQAVVVKVMGNNHSGMSFLGDVDEARAAEYAELLAPMWR